MSKDFKALLDAYRDADRAFWKCYYENLPGDHVRLGQLMETTNAARALLESHVEKLTASNREMAEAIRMAEAYLNGRPNCDGLKRTLEVLQTRLAATHANDA